ncbi:hypothetical protein [Variovorax terrae]|uniref:Uncharacterized protein n=1 Tax=Variovorax terrae TaxID=2923278 RepID=A0A9X1W0U5_9BURK|nr:hypothetical protein [Variovorax terrae]MCJ0765734.1 hypothetical protein [Variovorax terrae]
MTNHDTRAVRQAGAARARQNTVNRRFREKQLAPLVENHYHLLNPAATPRHP